MARSSHSTGSRTNINVITSVLLARLPTSWQKRTIDDRGHFRASTFTMARKTETPGPNQTVLPLLDQTVGAISGQVLNAALVNMTGLTIASAPGAGS